MTLYDTVRYVVSGTVALSTFVAVACTDVQSAGKDPKAEMIGSGMKLYVIHDDKRHVTCWRLLSSEGISCLPDRAFEGTHGE